MEVKKTGAVIRKQIKDTMKNKEILIQFIMFPIIAVIMDKSITMPGMQGHYFVFLFAPMYVGMAPLTVMSSIISEEREKNTLKQLLLSGVKPMEYLFGVGSCVWLLCMAGSVVFGITGEYRGWEMAQFLLIMAAGILTAVLIGAAIGTWSRNQMAAASVTVVIMLIFSFLPMLSFFNNTIKKMAQFAYSQQVFNLLTGIGSAGETAKPIIIIMINAVCACLLFVCAYKKSGLR